MFVMDMLDSGKRKTFFNWILSMHSLFFLRLCGRGGGAITILVGFGPFIFIPYKNIITHQSGRMFPWRLERLKNHLPQGSWETEEANCGQLQVVVDLRHGVCVLGGNLLLQDTAAWDLGVAQGQRELRDQGGQGGNLLLQGGRRSGAPGVGLKSLSVF